MKIFALLVLTLTLFSNAYADRAWLPPPPVKVPGGIVEKSQFDKMLEVQEYKKQKQELESRINSTNIIGPDYSIHIQAYVYSFSPPCSCPPNAQCEACAVFFTIAKTPGAHSEAELLTIWPSYYEKKDNGAVRVQGSASDNNHMQILTAFESLDSKLNRNNKFEIVKGKKYDFRLSANEFGYFVMEVKAAE